MKVKLVIVSPEVHPNEYEVTLPTKIGRGHEAKLKLVHPLVSRLHCELFADGEQVMIRDLDSLNGTFVDQQRLDDDIPLASGATVMMGTVMFRVVYGADADRLPPPSVVDMDKTVGAAGTVRKETLDKISKGDKVVDDDELWNVEDEEVDDPTTLVKPDEPLDVAFPDDEPTAEQPKGAVKPALPATVKPALPATAKPAQPPTPKTAAPAPKSGAPAKPAAAPAAVPAKPAAANPAADEELTVEPTDEPAADEGEDLDDFFKSIM